MSVLGWIAVPGGRVHGTALLRVLIVPRLQQQLAGTAMEDWPKVINAAAPLVEVESPGSPARQVPCTLRPLANSQVWQGFFGGIMVKPFEPPRLPLAVHVDETSDQARKVTAAYAAVADRPGDPTVTHPQLADWHSPGPAAKEAAASAFAKVDFHRAVSLLREHPHVLRALGLIVELDLAPADLPASGLIRVSWPASPIAIESPSTEYDFTGGLFVPAAGGDIASGQVDLADDEKWQVVTFDVDGAVGKLRETARTLGDAPADQRTMLPTLKSAGLQLVRRRRGDQLALRNQRGRTNLTAGSLTGQVFKADDLVLGYRLDVRPQDSNTWFSLQARLAEYTVGGQPIGAEVVEEEGHLKPYSVVRDGDALRADEVVARWSGWSLAVPLPTFDGQPSAGVPTKDATELIPYRFTAKFKVRPDSLPELRFGKQYQLRARVVDAAGGGLELDDPDAAFSPTADVAYTRYEPVPPPDPVVPPGLFVPDPARPGMLIADPAFFGPSGTLERLVVRTSPTAAGFSPADFAGDPSYPDNARRSFVPPATTFQLADHHGKLSIAEGPGWTLALRASRLAGDPLPDPVSLGLAAALLPEAGGLPEERTEARPWAGAWPDLDPKHLELVPGDRDDEIALRWLASGDAVLPEDDAQSTTVRVTVPPGEHVIVEISSTILRDHLDWFSLNALMSHGSGNAASVGRHPMVTPARRFELVHAVRRPLDPPRGPLNVLRTAGATFAVLQPQDPVLGLHTPSTAQLALRADWDEWTDAPAPEAATAPVPPVPVGYGAAALPELRQEFGDTKHRMVRYTATAAGRYRACFTPGDDELFQVSAAFDPVSVKSTAPPPPLMIVSTVPAFAWSDAVPPDGGLVRTRSAGRLRVQLARPWFLTGAGECVAVLVWPGTEETVPPEVRPLVSWVNRDPVHPTASPVALAAEAIFAGAVDPLDVTLLETGHTVRALPYPVFFAEGHWYADIPLPGVAQISYAPFAHLALARFQRESLAGCDLSPVVRTDMVPVLPDRKLEVRTEAGQLHITLTGLSRLGERPNRVTAALERCDAGDDGTPVELTALNSLTPPAFPAWMRVPGAAVTGQTNQPLPAIAVPGDGGRMRVVVREVEDLPATGADLVDAIGELTERTVYLDAVPLPTS